MLVALKEEKAKEGEQIFLQIMALLMDGGLDLSLKKAPHFATEVMIAMSTMIPSTTIE